MKFKTGDLVYEPTLYQEGRIGMVTKTAKEAGEPWYWVMFFNDPLCIGYTRGYSEKWGDYTLVEYNPQQHKSGAK
tara:strand:+ start:223 stop:447 length:225 start_codon:yes stop_codon:yes gene_type:complete